MKVKFKVMGGVILSAAVSGCSLTKFPSAPTVGPLTTTDATSSEAASAVHPGLVRQLTASPEVPMNASWFLDQESQIVANGGTLPSNEQVLAEMQGFAERQPEIAALVQAAVQKRIDSGGQVSFEDVLADVQASMQSDSAYQVDGVAQDQQLLSELNQADQDIIQFNQINPEPYGGWARFERSAKRFEKGDGRSNQASDRCESDDEKDERGGNGRFGRGDREEADRPGPRSKSYSLMVKVPVVGSYELDQNNDYRYRLGVPFPERGRTQVGNRWVNNAPMFVNGVFDNQFISNYAISRIPASASNGYVPQYCYSEVLNIFVPGVQQATTTECSVAAWSCAETSLRYASNTINNTVALNRDAISMYNRVRSAYFNQGSPINRVVRLLGATPDDVLGWMKRDARRSGSFLRNPTLTVGPNNAFLMDAIYRKKRPLVSLDNSPMFHKPGAHWVCVLGYDDRFVVISNSIDTARGKVYHLTWPTFMAAWSMNNTKNDLSVAAFTAFTLASSVGVVAGLFLPGFGLALGLSGVAAGIAGARSLLAIRDRLGRAVILPTDRASLL